jgi:hypothetical protein
MAFRNGCHFFLAIPAFTLSFCLKKARKGCHFNLGYVDQIGSFELTKFLQKLYK